MAKYNPRVGCSIIGSYVLNKGELNAFMHDIWQTTLLESFNHQLLGDGANAIIGIQWLNGVRSRIPTADRKCYINVGNVTFRKVPAVNVATREFVSIQCGTIDMTNTGEYDYSKFVGTSYKAYLPYVGIIDLDPRDVTGQLLWLGYNINITDGSAVCELRNSIVGGNESPLIFSAPCQWGYEIPVRVDPASSAITVALRMMSGGMVGGDGPSYTAGGMTANTGVLNDPIPKLLVYRRDVVAGDTDAALGRPSASDIRVGDASGYLKASTVFGSTTLPARHSGEIIQMLKDGVYL